MQSIITTMLSAELSNIIFNTLLHSLWQIPVIALGIKLIIRYRVKKSSLANYNANLSAMLIALMASGFTFCYYWLRSSDLNIPQDATLSSAVGSMSSGIEASADTLVHMLSWSEWTSQYDQYIVLAWALGSCILLSRIIAGWMGLRIIKRSITRNITGQLESSFNKLRDRLGLSDQISIGLSKFISVPMVIGHMKPIILLPAATINQLSIEEMEAVLAHELSHILQNDYLKNLVVMIAEAIYFYHPVIWMLSGEIKEERENICDDTVMKLFPDRLQYAKTLVKLEELYIGNSPRLSLALFTNKFKLMKRVKRILNMQNDTNPGKIRIAAVALLMCSLVVFSSADMILDRDTTDTKDDDKISLSEKVISTDNKVFADIDQGLDADIVVKKSNREKLRKEVIEAYAKSFDDSEKLKKISVDNIFDLALISPLLDTIDEEERRKLKKELKAKREEMRRESRKLRKEMRESRDKIKAQYKDEWDVKKDELKKLRKKLGDERGSSYYFDGDIDIDTEDLEEWADKMGEWGERFGESIAAQFDEDWVDKMEAWGESFGARFSEEFDEDFGEGWAEKFEHLGEELSEVFDEEWLEGIAEISEEVTEAFDEEWVEAMEDIQEEVAEAVEEAMEEVEDVMEDLDEDDYYRYSSRSKVSSQKTKERLINSLEDDGLLQDGSNTVTITDDEMKVNGQVQSKDILRDYQRIISRGNRNAFLNGETKVVFKIDGDNKQSLSISVDY